MDQLTPAIYCLRDPRLSDLVSTRITPDDAEAMEGIRCPLCSWRPVASSRWCCDAANAPEPYFPGCRTVWNTFATRGCCPGCQHQWQWTSCLRCGEWSPHADWYEDADETH